jgi:hypothetical protein
MHTEQESFHAGAEGASRAAPCDPVIGNHVAVPPFVDTTKKRRNHDPTRAIPLWSMYAAEKNRPLCFIEGWPKKERA